MVPNYTGTTVSMTEEMLTSLIDEEHQKAYLLPEAVSANVTSTGYYQTLSTLAIGGALYKLPDIPSLAANPTTTAVDKEELKDLEVNGKLYTITHPSVPEKIPEVVTITYENYDGTYTLTFKNEEELNALVDKIEAGEAILNVITAPNSSGINVLKTEIWDGRPTGSRINISYFAEE